MTIPRSLQAKAEFLLDSGNHLLWLWAVIGGKPSLLVRRWPRYYAWSNKEGRGYKEGGSDG